MKIAILTSGGDAPGMNACVRACVRYAIYNDVEPFVVHRGYSGLVNGDIEAADKRTVSDIIHRGGTKIKTARCPEFVNVEVQRKAADNLRRLGIEGLVVIGGDGSFLGAKALYENCGIRTIGIPATIDDDLDYTDFTIGFDTAVNTALDAINHLRDTMISHDRLNILEVMGRHCGDIALYSCIAGGAEIILVPEIQIDMDKLCRTITKNLHSGKTSNLIVLAEGVMSAPELMAEIQSRMDVSIRTTTLGHIQRGGMPSMADRVLAARMGCRAVEELVKGNGGVVVGIKRQEIIVQDVAEAVATPSKFDFDLYRTAIILSE